MSGCRSCSQCDCAARVVNGRPEEWVCANHPDHAGRLVLVAGGAAGAGDAPTHCRSFRERRDTPALPGPAPGDAVRFIRLTGGSLAIVDAADYEWLNQYQWRAMGGESGYAYRKVGRKNVCMHRLIMDAPPGKVVDHINGNRQDNRRVNLRVCTHAENMRNCRKSRGTSRFKGVYWDRRRGKWEAMICCGGKRVHLGRFTDEVKAAQAYDRAARDLFGEYAYLNFPEDGKVVRLRGCISVHSHAYGRLRVRQFEIRISKSETNSNVQNHKFKTLPRLVRTFGSLRHMGFEHCSEIPERHGATGARPRRSYRASRFVFCPFAFARGPPGREKVMLSKHPTDVRCQGVGCDKFIWGRASVHSASGKLRLPLPPITRPGENTAWE